MKPRILVSEKGCEMLEGNPSLAQRLQRPFSRDPWERVLVESLRFQGEWAIGWDAFPIADFQLPIRKPQGNDWGFGVKNANPRLRFALARFHAFPRSYTVVCVRPFHCITQRVFRSRGQRNRMKRGRLTGEQMASGRPFSTHNWDRPDCSRRCSSTGRYRSLPGPHRYRCPNRDFDKPNWFVRYSDR